MMPVFALWAFFVCGYLGVWTIYWRETEAGSWEKIIGVLGYLLVVVALINWPATGYWNHYLHSP